MEKKEQACPSMFWRDNKKKLKKIHKHNFSFFYRKQRPLVVAQYLFVFWLCAVWRKTDRWL